MSGVAAKTVIARSVVPMAVLTAAALVWHTSSAAFTANTSNPANAWTAGSVTLSDDDSGAAMFSATGLKPGSSASRCIQVTYGGALAAAVKLYVGSTTPGSPDLSPYVELTVDEGSGATFAGGCGSFVSTATIVASGTTLTALAAARTDYATGVGSWAPTGAAQTKSYRFGYVIDAAAPNTVQNATTTATFTWEAQNT